MADNSFNQNQWPDKNKGGEAKPDVDIRTSSSDMKSVAESGGGSPKPYTPATPPPPSESKPVNQPAKPAPVKPEAKQTFNEVFPSASQGQGQDVSPAPMNFDAGGAAGMGGTEGMKPKKSSKGLFVGILVVIIVAGLVALGYFFVYPVFFGGEEVAGVPIVPTESTETEVSEAEVPVVPEIPVVTGIGDEATTTPAVPSASLGHVSLFTSSADATGDITLSELSVSAYKSSIEFTTAEVAVLEERVFKNQDGEVMNFASLAGTLLPSLFTEDLSGSFEEDFTFFTYTDSNGTWPGFIVRVKSDSVLADVKTRVADIEASGNLANLYLSASGSQTSWKSGSAEGVSSRYLPFGLTGASLNYGWSGDLLLVSTSFSGFQEALKRL